MDGRILLKNMEMIFHHPLPILDMSSQIRRRQINFLRHKKPQPNQQNYENPYFYKFFIPIIHIKDMNILLPYIVVEN